MNFHLDTNAAIVLLNRGPSVVQDRLGEAKRSGDTDAARLWQFLIIADVVPFEEQDAEAAGELRAMLERSGTLIGPYDLLIAAHAIRRGATLVTANTREFSKVPGLVWEDWSVA